MFSPLRDPAQFAAEPLGAAGTPATGPGARDGAAAFHDVAPAPFAGWRASVRRALDVTVAFTTLESYTADDLLRPLARSADGAGAAGAPFAGARHAARAPSLDAPRAARASFLDASRAAGSRLRETPRAAGAPFPGAPRAAGASSLDPSRGAGGPRRRPAPSRARRAHAATPAEQHCITPLPGGPRAPRAATSSRHTPATAAARGAAPEPGAAGGRRASTRSDPAASAARRLG